MKAILPGICGLSILLAACGSTPDDRLGMQGNSFYPCSDSPNCVSSMANDLKHRVEPLDISGMAQEKAKAVIMNILKDTKRCRIITVEEQYIHAEYRSFLFRFVDDLELFFPENTPLIHIKSASRLGYSDFGVNRKRVEKIRSLFRHRAGVAE